MAAARRARILPSAGSNDRPRRVSMSDQLHVRTRLARIAIALSAAITVPAGLAAQAPAAGTGAIKVSNARFKVVVQGTQTTAWKHDHKKAFGCDADSKGEATEVVRFR